MDSVEPEFVCVKNTDNFWIYEQPVFLANSIANELKIKQSKVAGVISEHPI